MSCVVFERRVRVVNELGAGNAKNAKFATIVSVLTSLIVGTMFWSIILAFPNKLALIYTSSNSVITMVEELSGLLAFTVFLNSIQPILSGKKTILIITYKYIRYCNI